MENTQTAVEWLESELDFLTNYMMEEHKKQLFNQAKAMEKEQIMRAYKSGEIGEIYELNPVKTLTAKQYYENNYGK